MYSVEEEKAKKKKNYQEREGTTMAVFFSLVSLHTNTVANSQRSHLIPLQSLHTNPDEESSAGKRK